MAPEGLRTYFKADEVSDEEDIYDSETAGLNTFSLATGSDC
jgi:hypothetical protein